MRPSWLIPGRCNADQLHLVSTLTGQAHRLNEDGASMDRMGEAPHVQDVARARADRGGLRHVRSGRQ